jgi:predicted DNA-binding transcriptional regulator AlpA
MNKPPKKHTASIWDDLKSYENLPNATKLIEEMGRGFKAKSVQQTSDKSELDNPRLVTVKRLAAFYGLTLNSIYTLIKTDLSFPYKNVGVKKKYMVEIAEFEKWLNSRATTEKNQTLNIPKAADLIKRYQK